MKLQNNFTTPEQSKRLLGLGLPADSADCGIVDDVMHRGMEILQNPYSEWCKGYENISIPCWSVGRLIEIICKCTDDNRVYSLKIEKIKELYKSNSVIDAAISDIESLRKDKDIDFSKLED